MNKQILKEALKLANSGYTINIQRELTSTGEKIFFGRCLELDGCMAQGDSLSNTQENMSNALVDYIYFLLEDEMPVPSPAHFVEVYDEGAVSKKINVFDKNSGFKTTKSKRFLEVAKQFERKDENTQEKLLVHIKQNY